MVKLFRRIYGVGWMMLYFVKWPLFLGIPILYGLTPFQTNWVMNAGWMIAFTAILRDVWRIRTGNDQKCGSEK